MANKKISDMPNIGPTQEPGDILTALNVSAVPASQNVQIELDALFQSLGQNTVQGVCRPPNLSAINNFGFGDNLGAVPPAAADFGGTPVLVFTTKVSAGTYVDFGFWNDASSYYVKSNFLDNGRLNWITYDKATDTVQISMTLEPDNLVLAGSSGNAVFRFALAGYQDFRKVAAPGSPAVADLRLWADSTSGFLQYKNSAGTIVVLNNAGTPGGSTTQLQYNNAGAFGGISGVTSDGTNVTAGDGNLRATSPLITTGIDDANGNQIIGFTATGTAVNYVRITNGATGNAASIAADGETNVQLTVAAKGNQNLQLNSGATGQIRFGGAVSFTIRDDSGITQCQLGQGGKFSWSNDNNPNNGSVTLKLKRAVGSANGILTVSGNSDGIGAVSAGQWVVAVTAANTSLDVEDDSGKVFTNEGATAGVNFNLPSAPSLSPAGPVYSFIVQDADGITVTANSGDTIRIAGSVSAAAGTINSTVIGSAVTLIAINNTEWMAISMLGTWTVT